MLVAKERLLGLGVRTVFDQREKHLPRLWLCLVSLMSKSALLLKRTDPSDVRLKFTSSIRVIVQPFVL